MRNADKLPVAEPTFSDISHLVCKLVVLLSFIVDEGNICFRLWVSEVEGVVERPNTVLIGSVVGDVSLICGDFSAVFIGSSSTISSIFVDLTLLNKIYIKNETKKKYMRKKTFEDIQLFNEFHAS